VIKFQSKRGKMENFKILSLDGGGVRGYLSILILEKLEKALNRILNEEKVIAERFDLIAGTSTGGIIAAALAVHKSAKEIREIYEKMMKTVFTPTSKGIKKPKYNQKILKKILKEIFEDKTLNDVKTHLCITSVDIATSKPKFFKSPYLDIYHQRADEKLVDITLATSAAPVFFPLASTKHFHFLADGGLIANNPSMIAVLEGYKITKDFEKIKLLSIGTGEMTKMPYDVKKIEEYGGVIAWALNKSPKELLSIISKKETVIPLIEVLINAQSKLIDSQVKTILKEENFLRINPPLSQDIRLDEADKIDILKNLASLGDSEEIIKKVKSLTE
jgi:patatin-like phospholipase/acyl hydrolase